MKRIQSTKKQLGQGMAEYIIVVTLVAIGAYGVYNAFGKTLREEVAAASLGLSGQDGTKESQAAQKSANTAATNADGTAMGMDNASANNKDL